MSEQGPYEQLGVSEEASFDEIQEARNRLMLQCGDDRKRAETIEAAYDAVLMHRLKMRQEGKIKVPDRIRFAERSVEESPKPKVVVPSIQPVLPAWIENLVDTPSTQEIVTPGLIFAALGIVVLFISLEESFLQLILLGAMGTSIYFLNRKEHRLGRSVLLSFSGLILGLLLGYLVYFLFEGLLPESIRGSQVWVCLSLTTMWVTCSFLR